MKKKTIAIVSISVASAAVLAVVAWIIISKRRNNGLVVIGNVSTTNNTSSTTTNQNQTNMGTNQFNDMSLPRGFRNNNPLNIRKNAANAWKGKVVPGTDSEFEQFVTMAYGYRAALKLLRNYIGDGYNTIRKIINKWAPPKENNTASYINNVSVRTGISADTVIQRTDMNSLCKIAYAMAWSENSKAPASMDDIYQGWNLL